ncbi:GNAT family N-acetyltransferase [Streptococcus himalayensis]|uniref:N-acetyltransferase n=1 Tax=Streptococcus himalayensis TaxID=1888195 RepID=A0A917EG04_9STRE|nr:GNAT family N-acetyltransferase [Streptococcus himalayensis]GGE30814.1 N-acetyltransferase [Streptococcus himalayensis]
MATVDLLIREAEALDAALLVDFLNQVGMESDFMTLDATGILMTPEQMEEFILHKSSSDNQLYLLAFVDEQLAGVLSITADFHDRIRHIGQIFIVVRKSYWGQGLGRILLEEGIAWAEASGVIRRLELTVQARNHGAVHLYKSVGFEIEGTQARGACSSEGEFLDVHVMGKLID